MWSRFYPSRQSSVLSFFYFRVALSYTHTTQAEHRAGTLTCDMLTLTTQGNRANVVKIVPESAIKFFVYDWVKRVVCRDYAHPSTSERLLSGAAAGAASCTAIYPLDECPMPVPLYFISQNPYISRKRFLDFNTSPNQLTLDHFRATTLGGSGGRSFLHSHLSPR